MIKIEVNRKVIDANRGDTILSALRSNGIQVPTICSMKELSPTGACRMCVVEVEGFENLVPACSYRVAEWMKIKTHSPRVLEARKMNVELLLSNHPDDCLYCERNGNCELQKLSEDLNVRNRRIRGQKSNIKIDASSHGIIRDPAKCIMCGRCVRICEEIVGISTIDFVKRGDELKISPAMGEPLQFSNCIDCGMCVVSCPTGALIDNTRFKELHESLNDPDKIVVAQYTPEVAVSVGDAFGFKPGTDIKGLINNALRKIGFNYAFETAYGADVAILEQTSEFISRYRKGENLPLITSRCPAWVNYIEEFRPDLISNLMPIRSPHQIMGKLINNWFAETKSINQNRIHTVLISNCTATKNEASRIEYSSHNNPDIDFVLTTRELVRLIKLNGIDIQQLEPEAPDGPFLSMTSAGKLYAIAGGEMEATLRSVYRELNKKELQGMKIGRVRGLDGVKEATLQTTKGAIAIATVSGLRNAIELLDLMDSGKMKFDLLEVMVCPDGCVNGGGQPIPAKNETVKARIRTILDIDKQESVNVAHKNNAVSKMYEEYARAPGTDESKNLFLARFEAKKVLK